MTTDSSARIFAFPADRVVRQNDGGRAPEEDPAPLDETYHFDDGALALDADLFDIDEPDPLLITEGRNSDMVQGPRADIGLVETGTPAPQPRFMRLRDLHPIDFAIVIGFVALGILI